MPIQFNSPTNYTSSNGGVVYEVNTNTATTITVTSFEPLPGEKGTIDLNYSGSDLEGAGKVVRKIIPYRKTSAGVVTVPSKTQGFIQNETGFTGLDCDATVSGGSVNITVSGIINKEINHSLQVVRNFSLLNKPE